MARKPTRKGPKKPSKPSTKRGALYGVKRRGR